MISKRNLGAKAEFGKQLKQYRESVGLSQRQFASLMLTGNNYISAAERGNIAMGLDILEKYAAFFGVKYYQLGNPDFPVPTLSEIPLASRRAIARLLKEEEANAKAEAAKKAQAKEAGKPGRTKQLRGLLESGFFKTPRTAKDAFHKLNPDRKGATLTPADTTELGRITATLSQGKFLKLLDKLDPTEGSTAVRFVQKAVNFSKSSE